MCALTTQKGIPKKHNKYHMLAENHETYLKEYRVWNAMKRRCQNPSCSSYPLYGGRGIKVCERWLGKDGFINFYTDLGKRPVDVNGNAYQIDRKDTDGDYSPENCRWCSVKENNRNKRNNNIFLINGERMCAKDVSKLFGMNRSSLAARIKRTGEDKYTALFHMLERKWYKISSLTKERNML